MNLSLLSKTSISLAITTVVSLIIVWGIIRPKYEASVLDEQLAVVQQLQKNSIDNLDRTITSWLEVTNLLAMQVTRHPKEGELILRSMMSLHPEIIQIRIHSLNLSDELASQNTSYPTFKLQIADSIWLRSKSDSLLNVAWIAQAAAPRQIFLTRTRFQTQNISFILTVVWNAQQLVDIFTGTFHGLDYSMSIHSPSSMIVRNDSSIKITKILSTIDKIDSTRSVQDGMNSWRILKSPFHSTDLWEVAAVLEKSAAKPAERFMIYSGTLIISIVFVIFIIELLFTYQIKKLLKKLKT